MRNHDPIVIEEFNGLWARGGTDSTPLDHWSDCNNVDFIESGFKTRDGINVREPGIPNVLKVYNYPKISSESLLILDTSGNIFDSAYPSTPILTISGMLDFGLAFFAGRAYISPSTTVHGMAGEFLYVYLGDGTVARKAGGAPPTNAEGALNTINAGAAGNVEPGYHIFGAVYETDTGFLTQIGPDTLVALLAPGPNKVDISAIPVSASPYVTKVHIVATRAIEPTIYNGDTRGYEFFFIPGAFVTNGTTTLTVNFFDSELLDDASHLLDLYSEIPAGVGLTEYHGRLLLYTLEPNVAQNTILVSYPGEPEAFDQITGLIELEGDNQPITICRELRDVLYIFKYVKTFAINDNGDVPSSWNVIILDQGIGASLHGIASVLDTTGQNVDFLMVTNYAGMYLFNGTYTFPELSFKIADLWSSLLEGTQQFGNFQRTEIYNDSILKRIYFITPDLNLMIMADYQHGLDNKNIRWTKWTFDIQLNSICLTDFNTLIIGASE